MLGFLKKFFKREPEFSTEEVELAILSNWFDEKTHSKIESLNEELKQVNQKISEEVMHAKENLNLLNKAELMNPDIPERAKHFMQGNRDSFSKKINLFLERVHAPPGINDFPVFHAGVQDELKELMQSTAKPLQILQEFFAHESGKVMANIGNIGKEIGFFKQSFDNAGLNILDDTKKRIIDFQTKLNLRNSLEKDLETQKKELEESEKELSQLRTDVELLQKDKELNLLKDDLKKVQARIEETRERITTPFSVINSALRKYERITYRHRLIVQKYIDSPLDALMHDLHLSILKALHDMELAVMNNRIELKDKKKDKTLEVLKLLTKEYLGSFLTEYGQHKQEQDKIKRQLEQLDVVILLQEKKKRIKKIDDNVIEIKRKIELFSKELEKVDIEELETKLVENLKKITRVKVRILSYSAVNQ